MNRRLFDPLSKVSLARCIFHAKAIFFVFSAAISQAQTTSPSPERLPAPREVGRLGGETSGMVLFSPDGSKILTADGSNIIIDTMKSVQLWDARNFKQIGDPLDAPNCPYAQFDHGGKKLLTLSRRINGLVESRIIEARLWDVATGKPLLPPIRDGDRPLSCAGISADGSVIATSYHEDADVRLWDTATGKQTATLHSQAKVISIQFDPAGSTLIVQSDGAIDLWDIPSRKVRATLGDLPLDLSDRLPSISANGRFIATAGAYLAAVYDLATARKVAALEPGLHLDEVIYGISVSDDGSHVAISSVAGGALMDVSTGKRLFSVADAYDGDPVFSPDGTKVIFHVFHGEAMWDIPSARPYDLPDDLDCSLVSFSPDGKFMAIHSFDGFTSIRAIEDSRSPASDKRQR